MPDGVRAALDRSAVCTLTEFPDHAVFDGSEMLACVRTGLRGSVSGAGILALDPHTVMHLVGRRGDAPDPGLVPRYLELGRRLLLGLATHLYRALGCEPEVDALELVEGPLVPCVLGTHASPDTVVVSCAMRLSLGEASLRAVAYLLLDPKLAARLVDALMCPSPDAQVR